MLTACCLCPQAFWLQFRPTPIIMDTTRRLQMRWDSLLRHHLLHLLASSTRPTFLSVQTSELFITSSVAAGSEID